MHVHQLMISQLYIRRLNRYLEFKLKATSWPHFQTHWHFQGDTMQKGLKGTATLMIKIVNEYDQEIPQSQTADNPVAPRGKAAQPSRDTRKTN